MITTVLDTGPLAAALNAGDRRHAECGRFLATLAGRRLLPSPVPLGAVDASVIAVAERYGVKRVATLDRRHFTVVKPRHVPALTLLP
ncbi:hypothetical protein DBP19_20775 [Streptomyces sp. CS090A]|uniref:hypothetical protein n=1 Tax=Streptomyces sp. CS090A TaxID=2162710 RepID=UPI000D522EF6|nr:hypothetical protein [Streptomyces sp. CS090A]PVC89468.1 hypothetical protein DBP19_20775 [Streptomyces sp. CS090A]